MRNKDKFRILDVNLNRAREGLRVIEDIIRFSGEDRKLYQKLKRTRHSLSRITKEVYPQMLASRDSKNDIALSQKEKKRRDVKDILSSNFKRVEEATRVLEEFSKLVSADAGYKFKRIRFQIYTIEKDIGSARM